MDGLGIAEFALGNQVVRSAARLWLGRSSTSNTADTIADLLSDEVPDAIQRARLARLFEGFAQAVAEAVQGVGGRGFESLPPNEREAAILAVAETFKNATPDDSEPLAATSGSPALERRLRIYADSQKAAWGLSKQGAAYFDLLLRECCSYALDVHNVLPPYSAEALAYILALRGEAIERQLAELLDRLSASAAMRGHAVGGAGASAQPFAEGPRRLHVAAVNDAPALFDLLDIENDVTALASLIVARETSVPLAIAIAGRWGSGKSTFVRQLRAAVDLLLDRGGDPTAPGFVDSVCQIEFNAWHYSDDHLWVGLIEALFSGLSARFATGEKPPESPEEVLDRIEVLRAQRELLQTASEFVNDQPGKALSKLREAGSAETAWHMARALLSAAKQHLWAWAAANAVAIAGGAVLVALHHAYGWLAALVPVAATVQTLIDTYSRAHDQLKKKIADELSRVDTEFAHLEPVTSLANFLSQRASAQPYGLHRGVVGMVHQDLVALHKFLDGAARSGDSRVPARIVLYVDDIERCEPDRIARILTAINFLQNPEWRFVIVAAIDPQLLVKAVQHQYHELFGEITAEDYLDKIFQITLGLDAPSELALANLLVEVLGEPMDELADFAQTDGDTDPVRPSAQAGVMIAQPHTEQAPAAESPSTGRRAPERRVHPSERLSLTRREIAFMRTVACLLHTPRAAKRLANTYRLLRLRVATTPERLHAFLAETDEGADYKTAIVLLAIQASDPAAAGEIFHDISITARDPKYRDPAPTLRGVALRGVAIGNIFSTRRQRIADLIELLDEHRDLAREFSLFEKWGPIVASYSLHGLTNSRRS